MESSAITAVDNVRKLHLRASLLEREKLRRENPLHFYRPHRKQTLFHSKANIRYRFVRTGNRWGKSVCGTAEDLAFCLGERPWLPKDDPNRYAGIPKRPVKGVILVYDWNKASEIFTNQDPGALGKIFQLLPRDKFDSVEKTNNGEVSVVKIKSIHGGISHLHLNTVKSFLQNPMAHESSNWDFVHVDEPIPQPMWKAYSRGLVDSGGKAWFLCTPLNEPWITDFFIGGRQAEIDEQNGTEFEREHSTRFVIIGSSYDNEFLKKENLDEFASGLTEEERECRLYGNPLSLGGLVYNRFSRNKNVYTEVPKGWEAKNRPPKSYCIRYALDPHPRTPDAVLFAATAPSGEVFFFNEYFRRNDPRVLAETILEITEGLFVVDAIADPSAFIENPITGTTYADELAVYGLFFEKASKDLSRGIVLTNQALGEEMREGHRRLLFSDELSETLWEFDRYEWDAKRLNKPRDKDDHMMECLYRLVINGLDYVSPPDPNAITYFPQPSLDNFQIPRL